MTMKDDSIAGIYDTLKTALISKSAGGIGISVSNIRAEVLLLEPMVHPMDWFPCSGYSMIRHVIVIRVVEKKRVICHFY